MWSTAWHLMANKLASTVFYFLFLFLSLSTFFDVNLMVDALMSDSRESIYGKVLRLIVLHVSTHYIIDCQIIYPFKMSCKLVPTCDDHQRGTQWNCHLLRCFIRHYLCHWPINEFDVRQNINLLNEIAIGIYNTLTLFYSFEYVRVPEKDIVKYGVGPAQLNLIINDVNIIF